MGGRRFRCAIWVFVSILSLDFLWCLKADEVTAPPISGNYAAVLVTVPRLPKHARHFKPGDSCSTEVPAIFTPASIVPTPTGRQMVSGLYDYGALDKKARYSLTLSIINQETIRPDYVNEVGVPIYARQDSQQTARAQLDGSEGLDELEGPILNFCPLGATIMIDKILYNRAVRDNRRKPTPALIVSTPGRRIQPSDLKPDGTIK